MANTLASLAEDLIFFGQEVLSQLKAELVLVSKVRRDYRGADSAPGSHVQIPSIDVAGGAVARAVNGNVTASDVSAGSVTVTLGQLYQAISLDNLSRTFSNVDLANETASRIAYNVAKAADAQIAALAPSSGGPYGGSCGTLDGTSFFNSTDDIDSLAVARKLLTKNMCPINPARMFGVFGPDDAFGLRTLDSYKRADKSGIVTGRQDGALGSLEGFQLYETQQTAYHTLDSIATNWGTTGTLIEGGGGPDGDAVAGDKTITVQSLGTGDIQAGDRFTVAGDTTVYMVTGTVTIAANAAKLTISPPLQATPTSTAVVTPSAAVEYGGAMNMLFNGDAVLAVSRPQSAFIGAGITSVVAQDAQTGLSIRLSHESKLMGSPGMLESIVADILFGAKMIRPEYSVCGFGKS